MLEPGSAADCCADREANELSRPDEAGLVARAKAHPDQFGALYDRYYARILNYCYRRTLDVATAEEITSNTFFKALRGLQDYDHRGKFGAWLYRIAGNEIRLAWRTQRRRPDGDARWREDYARVRFAADERTSAEDFEQQARQFARLHDAVRRLPERYQTVLALRYFEGLAYDEVADVLEKRVGTVKSLIHRGLKRLRRQFEANAATFLQDEHCHVREECER